MAGAMGLADKDPARQWEWHESYRDLTKNMYRTTYTDASQFRETYVKSEFPVGYGGHIPSLRHDVLFRNTEFDRKQALMRNDPSRDTKPSFVDQIAGIPTYTKFPCGAKNNPSYKVCQRDGTTNPLQPWGINVNTKRDKLTHRTVPPTMKRAMSMPGLGRSNQSGMGAGHMIAGGSDGVPDVAPQRSPQNLLSPATGHLRRTVDVANNEAQQGVIPTEADILREHMRQ